MKQINSGLVTRPLTVDVPRPLVSQLTLDDLAREGRSEQQRYFSRRELRKLLPVSDMTIWRWQRDPQVAFPQPVKLGRNGRNFWWLPAILEWERRRTADHSVGEAS